MSITAGAKVIGTKELLRTMGNLETQGITEYKREISRTSLGIQQSTRRNYKKNYDNGQLDASIKREMRDSGFMATIYSDVIQSIYIEFGTKAHGPVTAEWLHFKTKDGKWVKTKWVKGIPANPGMLKAWIEWMGGTKFEMRVKGRFAKIK